MYSEGPNHMPPDFPLHSLPNSGKESQITPSLLASFLILIKNLVEFMIIRVNS